MFLRANPLKLLDKDGGSSTSFDTTDAKGEKSTDGEPTPKRRRLTSSGRIMDTSNDASDGSSAWNILAAEVCGEKATTPSFLTYTQLLWLMTKHHARNLPTEIEEELVVGAASALDRSKDRLDAEVWLLRAMEEIISAPRRLPPSSHTWAGAWSVVVRRVHAPSPVAENALQVLRAILHTFAKYYPHLPFSLREVWKAPVFEEENITQSHQATIRAAIELVVEASSVIKVEERERLLKWVMDITDHLSRAESATLQGGICNKKPNES